MGRHVQRVKSHVEESVVRTLSPRTLTELMGGDQTYNVWFVDSDVRVNNTPLTAEEAFTWVMSAAEHGLADKVRVQRRSR